MVGSIKATTTFLSPPLPIIEKYQVQEALEGFSALNPKNHTGMWGNICRAQLPSQQCHSGMGMSLLVLNPSPCEFGSKPPNFSIQVLVLALLLTFNFAFNSLAFIPDSHSDLSPLIPLAGTSFPIRQPQDRPPFLDLSWLDLPMGHSKTHSGVLGHGDSPFPFRRLFRRI